MRKKDDVRVQFVRRYNAFRLGIPGDPGVHKECRAPCFELESSMAEINEFHRCKQVVIKADNV